MVPNIRCFGFSLEVSHGRPKRVVGSPVGLKGDTLILLFERKGDAHPKGKASLFPMYLVFLIKGAIGET